MLNFFDKASEQLEDLARVPSNVLFYRVLPNMLVELLTKYLRVEVEGAEHIPRRGSAIITPNHSGFSGFDAVILGHEIFQKSGRIPKVLTHHLWFLTQTTAIPAKKMGFIEATRENGLKILNQGEIAVLFPEGENGNFKPSKDRYTLQEFKRGFVRMALTTQKPIIPAIIIGAEETHINLSKLKLSKFLRGTVLPLPLNILPLPAKWKIKFLEPIHLPYKPSAANRVDLVHEITAEIREKMQLAILEELKKREYVYVKGLY